jgi:hypothetical protein
VASVCIAVTASVEVIQEALPTGMRRGGERGVLDAEQVERCSDEVGNLRGQGQDAQRQSRLDRPGHEGGP